MGGVIDASIHFLDADEQFFKGNDYAGWANVVAGIGQVAMTAGMIILKLSTGPIGWIMIVVGMIIWVGALIWESNTKKYNELKIWLRHSRLGQCNNCPGKAGLEYSEVNSGCTAPSWVVQNHCKPDPKPYKAWTDFRTYIEGWRDGYSTEGVEGYYEKIQTGGMIKWPKSPDEHLISYRKLAKNM